MNFYCISDASKCTEDEQPTEPTHKPTPKPPVKPTTKEPGPKPEPASRCNLVSIYSTLILFCNDIITIKCY